MKGGFASMGQDARLKASGALGVDEILSKLGVEKDTGLDRRRVKRSFAKHGPNEISTGEKISVLSQLVAAFINPFTVVLVILAVVSFITDVWMAAPGERSYMGVGMIVAMVLMSGALRFEQEFKSTRAAERLKSMVRTMATVRRAGKTLDVPISQVVVGDIVLLSAGDMIPADGRVISAKDLFISQSALTGESEPVEKFATAATEASSSLLASDNLVFMGSNVVSGSATMVVVSVGARTVFGEIAKQAAAKRPPTSFEKGVSSVSWLLIRFMILMVPVVFAVNGFMKGDWMQAFLFAISVAIGLTPEMLPMVVSVNLAKGAIQMSKHKVVVKDLSAIQNLGSMDVLCSDKTGTITEDNVVLQYSLDINGKASDGVLGMAYLNSFHQTGLKNLIDNAIVGRAGEKGVAASFAGWRKIDEIPFDFERRRMSVVVEDASGGKAMLITKGALREMLTICSTVEVDGREVPLDEAIKKSIVKLADTYSADGMRVIAVARKNECVACGASGAFAAADEVGMVFVGLLTFLDPPKATAPEALRALASHGVNVKILTGDSDKVARFVCKKVGIASAKVLVGADIEAMDDGRLRLEVEKCNIFARLSPNQKARIVAALRANGHVVGFMGDGINDATAMRIADVAISVDTAVDIAKDSASIILLEKSLLVLNDGVLMGRRTYANIIKYIKLTASSNFGNMFSVLFASAMLPFLPMLPIQILLLNLISDASSTSVPWDNVDEEYVQKPRNWDARSIKHFMIWFGPMSSIFDIIAFGALFFWVAPGLVGGAYGALGAEGQAHFATIFQSGWFMFSLWSQSLIIHFLRTKKIPFVESRASWQVSLASVLAIWIGTLVAFTTFGRDFGLVAMPAAYFAFMIAAVAAYMGLAEFVKGRFVRRFGELL
ncbi:MAG: magnesium-translocating P-type ATPase [Alphaproteobacteria bacterium]|nr:magnesium-translocating P-type ATPase [Alphaproteobacteria bacterium]